jgi:quercetin dioxygenase-like cupin family protein
MKTAALPVDALALHGVSVVHHFGGGVYAKETLIPAGVRLAQHVHPHDHLSILAAGLAIVEAGGSCQEYAAPACITIAAGVEHSIAALTDVIWYCVHATDDTRRVHTMAWTTYGRASETRSGRKTVPLTIRSGTRLPTFWASSRCVWS